jgi:IS30 family transposase
MEDGVRYNAPHSRRHSEAGQARHQLPVIVNAGDKTSRKLSGDTPANVAQVHPMQVSFYTVYSSLYISARAARMAERASEGREKTRQERRRSRSTLPRRPKTVLWRRRRRGRNPVAPVN